MSALSWQGESCSCAPTLPASAALLAALLSELASLLAILFCHTLLPPVLVYVSPAPVYPSRAISCGPLLVQ